MMCKKWLLRILAAFGALCVVGPLYYFILSPDRENHWRYVRSRGRVSCFRIAGTTYDQYGHRVPYYDMVFALYPRAMGLRIENVARRTDGTGQFEYDSKPLRVTAVLVAGKSFQNTTGEWYEQYVDCGGEFVYQGRGLWLWRHDPKDPWKKVEPETRFDYHIGHMGPPDRMIQFRWQVRDIPITDDCRSRISVLADQAEPEDCADCDFELQVLNAKTAAKTDGTSFTARVVGLNGATLRVARDPFLREAPPAGYTNDVSLESAPCQLKIGWLPAITKWLYFRARDGQVYGRMLVDVDPFDQERRLSRSITVVANPRGSRNLNDGDSAHYCEPLPLPVTLPFKEDNPDVDGRRIWAFVDHTRDDRLIVKGKEGSIEPGCSVEVVNQSFLGQGRQPSDIIDIVSVESQKDGSFEASVSGKEGDSIGIHVVRWRKGMPAGKTNIYLEHSWQGQTSFLPTAAQAQSSRK